MRVQTKRSRLTESKLSSVDTQTANANDSQPTVPEPPTTEELLLELDYPDKDVEVIGVADPLIVGPASQIYEKDEHPFENDLHLAPI